MSYNLVKLNEEIVKCKAEFEKVKSKYMELYFRKEVVKNELEHVKRIEEEHIAAIPAIKPDVEKIRNLWRTFITQRTIISGMEGIGKQLPPLNQSLTAKDNLKFQVTQKEHEITMNKLIKEYEKCPYVKEINDRKIDLEDLRQKNNYIELELKNTRRTIIETTGENYKEIIKIADVAVKIKKSNIDLSELKLENSEMEEKKQQLQYREYILKNNILEIKEKNRIEALKKAKEPIKMIKLFEDLYQPMLKIPLTPQTLRTTALQASPQQRQFRTTSPNIPTFRQQQSPSGKQKLPPISPPRPQLSLSPHDVVLITDNSCKEGEIHGVPIIDSPRSMFKFGSSQSIESPFDVTKPKIPKLSHTDMESCDISDNVFDLGEFNFNENQEQPGNDTFDFEF